MFFFVHTNSNTSISTPSRDERKFVRNLIVKFKSVSQHGNSKVSRWKYFGGLFLLDGTILDDDRLYCSVCLDAQKMLGDKGHLSQVSNFANTISTGNLNLHLSQKHDVMTRSEKSAKIASYFKKYSDFENMFNSAASNHEIQRDIVFWLCRDLLPIDFVQKEGRIGFKRLTAPSLHIPTPEALSGTALEDYIRL